MIQSIRRVISDTSYMNNFNQEITNKRKCGTLLSTRLLLMIK